MTKRWRTLLVTFVLLTGSGVAWAQPVAPKEADRIALDCWLSTAQFRQDLGSQRGMPAANLRLQEILFDCVDKKKGTVSPEVYEAAMQRVIDMVMDDARSFMPRVR